MIRGALSAALLALLLWAGCARSPELTAWSDRMLVAERNLSRGNYDVAMKDFELLQRNALGRSDEIYARMRQAEVHRRAGRHKPAIALMHTLAHSIKDADPELQVKVHYRYARQLIDGGQVERGHAKMQRIMDRFPNAAFGTRAFVYLRGVQKERGEKAFLAWLKKGYKDHPDSALADNFLYEAAHIAYKKNTREADRVAENHYALILKRWRFESSGHWDDALWELSHVLHRRGRYPEELRLMALILSKRETTWLGSEQIAFYIPAFLRIGQVLHQNLRRFDDAAAHFAKYPTIWVNSRREDDFLWWEAWSLKRAGREESARAAFDRLVRRWPESKYAKRVKSGAPGPDLPEAP